MKQIIGITGGIASGKSNVCSIVMDYGYPVIDCDKISHDLSIVGKALYNAIIDSFGKVYLDKYNNLDRKKLGNLIYHDSAAREKLNQITHPIIKDELIRQIEALNSEIVFIEVPLLYESGFDELCDYVICVYLPKEIQIKRLMARERINEAYAIAKINSQMGLEEKRTRADFVVDSRGTFDETESQVFDIIKKVKGV